jgi:hypothetical protein
MKTSIVTQYGNSPIYLDFNAHINSLNPVVRTFESIQKQQQNHAASHNFSKLKPKSCRCNIIPEHLQKQIDSYCKDKGMHVYMTQTTLQADRILKRKRKEQLINGQIHSNSGEDTHENQFGFFPQKTLKNPDNLSPEQLKLAQNQLRTVYNVRYQGLDDLPGRLVCSITGFEGITTYKKKGFLISEAATKAMENASETYLYYLVDHNHNSIDGNGMEIKSCIHPIPQYNNALWDGEEMVYGDGDGKFLDAFYKFLDIGGHEMSHGVQGNKLDYTNEAGAMNESFADVMGYLVKIRKEHLKPSTASWLLADGILMNKKKTYPLRSFINPGEAYDIPKFGKDPQRARYSDLYVGEDDEGGVHINSGIPNKAFYLFITRLEELGIDWKLAGMIWFKTMMHPKAFPTNATLKQFAEATILTAESLPETKNETRLHNALSTAWQTVEVIGIK